MAKKRILERNYEKCYIYFNKNNNFQDILLKIGMYTLYIVPKIVLNFIRISQAIIEISTKFQDYHLLNWESFI